MARFNVLVAHRRFGKTVFAVLWLIQQALSCKLPRPQVFYFANTYSQAKKIAWLYCKQYTWNTGTEYNEAELTAKLPNGALFFLGSGHNPDSNRGIYCDAAVLDEPAQMSPRLWTEVLRPAMADRYTMDKTSGRSLMIGTPQGRHGLFAESYFNAESEPDWWRGMYKATDTGIIDPGELEAARRTMSEAEFNQEFLCSFDAAVRGSYYGAVMDQLEQQGHISSIVYDNSHPCYFGLDLGFNDATAVWVFQIDGNTYRFVDHFEFENTALPDIVGYFREQTPYRPAAWLCPHDVDRHSLETGRTRKEALESMGVTVTVAPRTADLQGDIEETRMMLTRCRFDREKCAQGLEALRQYRSEYDDIRGVLKLRPVHDWTSHSADAARTIACTDQLLYTGQWSGPLDYSNLDRARL